MREEEKQAIEYLQKMEVELQIANVQVIMNKDNAKYYKTILEMIKNSISKDKIREKIKELEKEKTEVIHELDFKGFYTLSQLKDIEISILNELLEE